jgi:hypothetical protein
MTPAPQSQQSPRTRIGRLAEAIGRPAPLGAAHRRTTSADHIDRIKPPKRPGTGDCAGSRSFDTGAEVAVYTAAPAVADVPLYREVTGTAGTVVPMDAGRLADTVGTVGQAGSQAGAGLTLTNPALDAAPAGVTDVADVSASMARSMSAPGDDADAWGAVAPAAYAPAAQPAPAPPATENVAGWTVAQPPAGDDASFAADIQAILAHAQSVSGSGPRMPLPDVPGAAPTPLPPAEQRGVGVAVGHDVFDVMAAANAPNRFDQGPVSLSVDFDRLDSALADQATAPAPASAPATAPAPAEPAAPVATAPTAADVADVAAITARATPFRVITNVPLVPQGPGLSCHAAACASLVAWRDEVSADSADVAAGTGYWEKYAEGRTASYPDVFGVFDLATASDGAPPSAAALRDLLDTKGPLFAAASPPAEHAVIVSGITGDGTTSGTVVDVVDPWAAGMTTYSAPNPGSTYSVPHATLLDRLGAGPEHHLVVAHLRKGSS